MSNWSTGVDGDWNTGTLWTPATVPTSADDVVIDAADTAYTVTIASGETAYANSLTMNDVTGRPGTNDPAGYHAAELLLDGTLDFAAISSNPTIASGSLGGSLQTYVFTDVGANAAIINGGTLNAFLLVAGTLTLTGTNAVYITNEIQALGGTVTIDTPIAPMTGTTLYDGIYAAIGSGSVMNLGGKGNPVDIVQIEGPQGNTAGWTELTFADPTSLIDEWSESASAYVSVETSLTEISGGGTVDLTYGRDFNTTNTLTIDHLGASVGAGMLNIEGVTVTTAGIDINGGIVQGYGTIASDVANNGTLIALGGTAGGTLEVTGNLTGTGSVLFDMNEQEGANDPTLGTLVLHVVSAGQTVTMNGGDTLELANPGAFAGTIAAGIGDKIVLDGLTATSATLNNGTLVVSNGSVVVASLALSGSYTGDSVTTAGSILTFGTAVAPVISGTAAGQAVTDTSTVSPFAHVVIQDGNIGQTETVTVTLSAAANGTLSNLGNGTYDPTTGVYKDTGSAAAVTADLNTLLFTPTAHEVAPGQSVTSGFTISDVDSLAQSATDSTTSVIATAGTVAPTISGTIAGQAASDQGTIAPFANVAITDANFGQTETVTVTVSAPSNGALTNLGTGSYNAATGVYTITGAAADVSSALDGLVFVPTRAEVPGGQTITTGFTIGVSDSALASASNTATSVVVTAVAAAPGSVIQSGSSSQYVIANDGGTLYVADTVANRNGTQVLPGVTKIMFTDGVGVFDPTGNAEDIARLYQTMLDRAPDLGGLQYWTNMVDNSTVPLSAVANMFASSPEFIQKNDGSLSDTDFVNQLYENSFGRAADPSGSQYWTAMLASGTSRGTVAGIIAQSAEAKADSTETAGDTNNGEVYRLYETAFARAPDSAGGTYWTSTLGAGETITQVAQAFVQSAEFKQDYGTLSTTDFVTALYQNALHRAPDAGGLQYWTAALQGGMSQASVMVSFSDSLESRATTANATHDNWVFLHS
jgi:hypothetical protein